MTRKPGLVVGPDRRKRCFWAVSAPDYVAYHDHDHLDGCVIRPLAEAARASTALPITKPA